MASGDWYVALVGAPTAFDPAVHNRRDLSFKAVRITETEEAGQARVRFLLTHYTQALRGSGMPQYMLLSRQTGDGNLRLMAQGRLVGIPSRGAAEDGLPVVEYDCSPVDWRTPEAAACAAKQTLPQYDELLVAPEQRTDPKEILDGWFATVHCDRATWAFTTPDSLGVGLPGFNFPRPFFDPLPRVSLKSGLVSEVDITLSVDFVQMIDQVLDVSAMVNDAFTYNAVDTLTPQQLEKSWFKAGSKIGGNSGWTWLQTKLTQLDLDTFPSPVPLGTPVLAGPFTGAPEKQTYTQYYSWTANTTLTTPYEVSLADGRSVKRYTYVTAQPSDLGNLYGSISYYQRCYYAATLTALASIRQKRTETIQGRVISGTQTVSPGLVKRLVLKCQNIRDQSGNEFWKSNNHYAIGSKCFVGYTQYECLVDHISQNWWALDQVIVSGTGVRQTVWQELPEDETPNQSPANASYLLTARGQETWQAAVCKARRIMAASSRNAEIIIRHFLTDDLLGISTAANGTVSVPPDLLDGGGCTAAKIVAYEIYSGTDDEYVNVTLLASTGSGLPYTPNPVTYDVLGNVVLSPLVTVIGTVNVSGQSWDQISWSDFTNVSPPQLPILSASVQVVNDCDAQATYLDDHCFVWNDATRNDDRANEPDKLLKDVPTSVNVIFSQISGFGTMSLFICPTMMNAWSGPKQYNTEAAHV